MSRGRGRPAGRSAGDTRVRLIEAAREQFAARGFAATSVRSIATAAGVDASLINHHFGGKEGLFVATLELPIDPLEKITGVIAEGRERLGERLIRTFLTSWDPHRGVFSSLVRRSLADGGQAPAIEMAQNVLATKIAEAVGGDLLRGNLVAAQIIGLGVTRYVAEIEPVVSASIDDVVAAYGPAIQAIVDGPTKF